MNPTEDDGEADASFEDGELESSDVGDQSAKIADGA